MSNEATARVWKLDLPHSEGYVLMALADHADQLGDNIFPSIGLIAWKTGYSTRQVQRIIKSLLSRGILIEVMQRDGKSSMYRMDLNAGPVKEPYLRQNVTPDKMSPLTKRASSPRQNVTPTPDILTTTPDIAMSRTPDIAMSPLTIINHHIKSSSSSRAHANGDGSGNEEEEEKNEWDEGDEDDGIDPYELHREEADRANVRRDLVDALVALGIYPTSAYKAVMDRTVTSDQDIVRCKRSGLGAGKLWQEYLSQGMIPPRPDDGTSTVTADQIAYAREQLRLTDERNAAGDQLVSRFKPIVNPLKSMNGTSGGIVRPPEGFWR